MADDLQHTVASAAAGAAISGVVAGLLEWARRRKHPRAEQADVASSISSAFQRLVDQLQEENGRHLDQIKSLSTDATKMRSQLRRLRTFTLGVVTYMETLEAQLRGLGVAPAPGRPDLSTDLTGG